MDRAQKSYEFPESAQIARADAGSSQSMMLRLTGSRKSVLKFGCATGNMAEQLVAAGCRVVGVESNAEMAARARPFCDETVTGDLDVRALDDILPERKFDVLIFGDVLEHLHDPWRVLDESRHFVATGGYAIISIPNVAHGSVRLAFLSGSFEYAEAGLLDDTNIRFFTHQGIVDLCARAGYQIETIDRVRVPIFTKDARTPHVLPEDFDPAVVDTVARDPEAETFQFVIKATPLDDAKKRDAIYKRFMAARADLNDARRGAQADSETARSHATALQERLDSESRRATAESRRSAELAADLERQERSHADTVERLVRAHSESLKRIGRALATLVLRVDESEDVLPADSTPVQTIKRIADVFARLHDRMNDGAGMLQRLEQVHVDLTLANASLRMEVANRIFERDGAESERKRLGDLLAAVTVELTAARARIDELGPLELGHALVVEARERESEHSRDVIDSLSAQLADATARVARLQEAYAEKEFELVALGELHRGLSETDGLRVAAIAAKESEIARLFDAVAGERDRHAATRTILSEFLAYEISIARHQAATVDRMIATYRSSKWWSLKRLLQSKRGKV